MAHSKPGCRSRRWCRRPVPVSATWKQPAATQWDPFLIPLVHLRASLPPAGQPFALPLNVGLTGGSPLSSNSCVLQTYSRDLSSFLEILETAVSTVKAICEASQLSSKSDDISQDETCKESNDVCWNCWSALVCDSIETSAYKGAESCRCVAVRACDLTSTFRLTEASPHQDSALSPAGSWLNSRSFQRQV